MQQVKNPAEHVRTGKVMRLTLKMLNDEFKRLGHDVELAKGDGYFYFHSGEAANWLETTVNGLALTSLTLEQ